SPRGRHRRRGQGRRHRQHHHRKDQRDHERWVIVANTSARKQGERGAAALSLFTVAIISSLAVFFFWAAPLTKASDSAAKGHSAADAAALAGVEYVREDLGSVLSSQGWLGNWSEYQPLIGGGLASAKTYAQRNDAELVSYQPPTPGNHWTAYAEVRHLDDDDEYTREATAKLDLPSCTVDSEELEDDSGDDEGDSDDEDDSENGDDEDKPSVLKTVTCGDRLVSIEVDPDDDDGPLGLDLPA